MSAVWNNTFWLYPCEFLRPTESQSRNGRPQADRLPCWCFSPSLCSCEEWERSPLDGPLWLGLKAASLQVSLDMLALVFFLLTASQSSDESAPVLSPSLFFNLVIPSFFYLFIYDWFQPSAFYFWGEAGSWEGLQEVSATVSDLTGHLCWVNPHPMLWETLQVLEAFKHNSSLKTSHGGKRDVYL